jgi:hypothetical protein
VRYIFMVATIGLLATCVACSSNAPKSAPVVATSTSSTAVRTVESDATLLREVSWQTGDVRAPYHLVPYTAGDEVTGQVTLDVCGATFPSEQRRRARHQVGVADRQQRDTGISIEAVSYDTDADAVTAMGEVRKAQADCPSGYVRGDVAGVPPLRYRFAPAPDTTWAAVAGVDRFALAATVNDQQGHVESDVAVYLRRGRLLVILYSNDAASSARVLTRSIEAFTEVLERRMPPT